MRIFLTGATGFIGQVLARQALARGDQVAGLCRAGGPFRGQAEVPLGWTELRGDLEQVPWAKVAEFAPDVCVHAAWITTPGVYMGAAENAFYQQWGLELAQGLLRCGIRHLLVIGSCAEYQMAGRPLTEDQAALSQDSPYARAKNGLHQTLRQTPEFAELRLGWGRLFYPYGPGELPLRLCSQMVRTVLRGEPVELRCPNSVKDYIFIDDVARALLTLADGAFVGTINLGTGQPVRIRELAATIAAALGRPELVKCDAKPALDPLDYAVADPRKLQALGWQPRVSLPEGITRLIRHLAS